MYIWAWSASNAAEKAVIISGKKELVHGYSGCVTFKRSIL
jgi:hypothetical protein